MPTLSRGVLLASIYVLISAYLLVTQGLFGESFIAIILGMPWSLALSYFEYWNLSGPLLVVLLLAPIALNAYIIYWLGSKTVRA